MKNSHYWFVLRHHWLHAMSYVTICILLYFSVGCIIYILENIPQIIIFCFWYATA